MVAAAKLRRAQEAAEAARPYSQRMATVLANITPGGRRRRRSADADDGNRQGRRPSAGRVHGRARTVRRLQFADRPFRARAHPPPAGRRQDGEDHHRRQEGLRHTAPRLRFADHRPRRPARGQAGRLRQCRRDRPQGHRAVRRGPVRRLHAVLFRIQVGDQPGADGAADHPVCAGCRRQGGQRRDRRLRIRAGARRDPRPTSSRATSRCRCSARCWRMRRARWAPR